MRDTFCRFISFFIPVITFLFYYILGNDLTIKDICSCVFRRKISDATFLQPIKRDISCKF